tara:strand:+ start:72525 stop:73355 length:831 start_codon:yes stop_codon:yes gene_type:complete
MDNRLRSRTILITGASRGIGREIALKVASLGAHVVIAAKSDTPHPKLPGTIHSVADEVRALGAKALAVRLDVRDDASIAEAMEAVRSEFGGLDALVNNAGAIRLEPAEKLDMKRFDLIHQINTRAVLAMAKAALPMLKASSNPHILSLSPPLNLKPEWLGRYIPYTVTKYGMTLLSLGLAEEFRPYGIGVNTLWPRTTISTAAVEFEVGKELLSRSRRPSIVADAAAVILQAPAGELTGRTLIDDEVLREAGECDFGKYRSGPAGAELALDLYVDR